LFEYFQVLNWLKANQFADNWADIVGLVVTVLGFTATLIGVFKSKRAAVAAQEAAVATRDQIRLLDTIVDFSAVITILEEIKRAHRSEKDWSVMPDKYASLRKQLILLRETSLQLSDEQLVAIQNAITNLSEIEKRVERHLISGAELRVEKFNATISDDIDRMVGILTQLKAGQEVGNGRRQA